MWANTPDGGLLVQESLGMFLLSAGLITLSGVLMPGPLTAAVIQHGGRSPMAGIYASVGHAVVEVPIIALMAFGAGSVLQAVPVRVAVGLAGGLYMGYLGIRTFMPAPQAPGEAGGLMMMKDSSLMTGVVLSIGNPSFVLWWATVGLGLVIAAMGFGLAGVVLFTIIHLACDFAWMGFLSAASYRGKRKFGESFFRRISMACGATLVFFGAIFIISSLNLMGNP